MAPSPTSNADHYKESIKTYRSGSSNVSSIIEPITSLYRKSGAAACESDLWTLWGIILDTATNTSAADISSQQNLANLVKEIKAQGPITTGSDADTSAGKLWTGLPFLGYALRERWNDAPPFMSTDAWTNLNMFVACLCAANVHDANLLGLWTLRMALEVQRPLTERDASGNPKLRNATLDELLPAACAWLSESVLEHVATLSIQGRGFRQGANQPDPGQCGEMAKAGETGAEEEGLASGDRAGQGKMVARVEESGFSAQRWRFWCARLRAVSEMRDEAGGREKVAKIAFQTLEGMRAWDARFGIGS